MIQLTWVDAVHAHSGCVVTVIVPVPAAGPTTFGPESDTSHLGGEGPTAVVEVAPQPLATTASPTAIAAQAAARGTAGPAGADSFDVFDWIRVLEL